MVGPFLALALLSAPLAVPDTLAAWIRGAKPDSVAGFLQSHATRATGADAAAALLTLGRYEYARGEYRSAAIAFARAAARLEPAAKNEARYWSGLGWFALGDLERARAEGPRRAGAQLALAQLWEASGRSDRAIETLDALLVAGAGDLAATALAMQLEIATAQGREAEARRAAERLLREFPQSLEAARIGARVVAPPVQQGQFTVRLGAFSDDARARQLAAAARRAGFAEVRVLPPSGAGAPLHIVQIGPYPDADQAQRQAERTAELLGVIPERSRTP
jgi:tetratricopeptide (TPR) repeat protein